MAIDIKKLNIVFIKKGEVSPTIFSFSFMKPVDFHFTAGQYIQIILPHEDSDEKGTTRYFSIASAPEEKEIMIVTRESNSSFKRQLFALMPGDTIAAFGPLGTFVMKN